MLYFLPSFSYTHTAGIVCYFTSTKTATNREKLSAVKTHTTCLIFPFVGTAGFLLKTHLNKALGLKAFPSLLRRMDW